jgi:hypothetical protein
MGDGMGRAVMTAGFAQPAVGEVAGQNGDEAGDHDDGATAWRLRHLKRSVLRDTTEREDTIDGEEGTEVESYVASDIGQAPLAAELWSGLPLSGQVQLLTTSTFDRPEELFANSLVRGVAYVTVTAPVGQRGTWAVQGAVTQGDLSSWVLGGTYAGRLAAAHSLDAGLSYAAQRYVGPNPLTFVTLEDGSRTVGAMFAFDEWSLNPKATLKYGAHYARYGYLADPGLFSPSVNFRWAVGPRVWLHATAARQMLAPGAEEFIPSSVAGMWLPPQRTFSCVSPDGRLRAEEASHLELAVEREVASFVFTARGFREDVDNQIVTLFGANVPGNPIADPGHYFTANVGRLSAFGWGVAISRPVASRLRGSLAYTLTHGVGQGGAADAAVLAVLAPSSLRPAGERVQDLTAVVETDIPEIATRVYAAYRISTGFAAAAADSDDPELDARFDVQVSQRLPFLAFTNAQWELLLAVRNMFRDLEAGAFYDELLVIRPPKRIVGGLTVRF